MVGARANSDGNGFYKVWFIISSGLMFGLLTVFFMNNVMYPAPPRRDIVLLQNQITHLTNNRNSRYSSQLNETERSRLKELDFSDAVTVVRGSSRFGYSFLVTLADGDKCIFNFDYYSQKFQRQYDLDVSCSGW